ncbi:MAG: redox-sensing transcriptional repressor Rex [Bacteroidales bacterium]|nr:redox-sensing transcriptional repressor Rex [Bacteroidales bacterium]
MKLDLPKRTVERLSKYRRILLGTLADGKTHIYSHELAGLLHITAVQVRRDMMLMGFSSMLRKGYDVKDLIEAIGDLIDTPAGMNVAVVGLGNFGQAVTTYLQGRRPKLHIVATFDVAKEKIGRAFGGVQCYSMEELPGMIREQNIQIAVLTVPIDQAQSTALILAELGIKGILNFTTVPLHVPEDVCLEEYDMITSIEKVAYFVKHRGECQEG